MQVELLVKVRIPFTSHFIDKGTILTVEDIKGYYYVCNYENYIVSIHKDNCLEVKE